MADRDLEKALTSMRRDLQRVKQDLDGLAKDSLKATKQAGATGHEATDAALRTLESEAHSLLEAVKGIGASAVEGGQGVVSDVEEHIETNPLAMVAAALGVGVAIGLLVRRWR